MTPQWQQGPSFFTIGGTQSLKLLHPFTCGTIALPSANNKLGEAYTRSLYMDVDEQWIVNSFAKDLAIMLGEMWGLLFGYIVLSS